MIEDLTFLEEGKYTPRDKIVRLTAEKIRNPERTPWVIVSEYIKHNLIHKTYINDDIFRKRTASQILESGYTTGCTDTALAFIVLARELCIPTRYVETFDKNWLADQNAHGIKGHIFVDIFVNGRWKAYEPKGGFTFNNEYVMHERGYVEIGKGLDFSEIYIKENGIYRSEPTNLQSLNEAIKVFKPSVIHPKKDG